MSSPACAKCSKPVYATEKLSALNQTWHTACFQCDTCQTRLTLKSFTGVQGRPYCSLHVPAHKANFAPNLPGKPASPAPAATPAAAPAPAPAPAAAPTPTPAPVPATPEPTPAAAEPAPEIDASVSEVAVVVTTLDIQEDASTVLEVTEVDVVNSKGEVIESVTEVSEIKITTEEPAASEASTDAVADAPAE